MRVRTVHQSYEGGLILNTPRGSGCLIQEYDVVFELQFSKQLQGYVYSKWKDYYIDYAFLKQTINQLYPQQIRRRAGIFSIMQFFRPSPSGPPNQYQELKVIDQDDGAKVDEFRVALEYEANKVDTFYIDMERKLNEEYEALCVQLGNADLADERQMDAIQSTFVHLYVSFLLLKMTGLTLSALLNPATAVS